MDVELQVEGVVGVCWVFFLRRRVFHFSTTRQRQIHRIRLYPRMEEMVAQIREPMSRGTMISKPKLCSHSKLSVARIVTRHPCVGE